MLPRFTLSKIILLTNLTSTIRQSSLLIGQTNKRMQDMKVTECEMGIGDLINGFSSLITESKISIGELVAKLSPLFVKNFSRYSDYYSPTPKVIITLM